jgi:hypothetical protein
MEALVGTMTLLSFFAAALLTAVIKRFVDEDQVRQHPNIRKLFSHDLLPKEVLTPTGKCLWFWRNVSFAVAMTCVAVILVWKQLLMK